MAFTMHLGCLDFPHRSLHKYVLLPCDIIMIYSNHGWLLQLKLSELFHPSLQRHSKWYLLDISLTWKCQINNFDWDQSWNFAIQGVHVFFQKAINKKCFLLFTCLHQVCSAFKWVALFSRLVHTNHKSTCLKNSAPFSQGTQINFRY